MLKDRIEDSLTFVDVLHLLGHSKLLSSKASVNRKIIQTWGYNIPLLISAIDIFTQNKTTKYIVSRGRENENNPQEN